MNLMMTQFCVLFLFSLFFVSVSFLSSFFFFNCHFLYCYDGKWKCRGKFNLINIHFLYTSLNIYVKFNMNIIENC
jgi:hypothetical protein